MRDWTGEVGHWAPVVAAFQQEPWCQQLMEQVEEGYGKTPAILPPREDLFTALRLTGPESVRCVILGQVPTPPPAMPMVWPFPSVPEWAFPVPCKICTESWKAI